MPGMPTSLIDTSILVDLLRGHSDARDWLAALSPGEAAISFVTAAELLAGARNQDGPADLVVEVVSPESAGRDRGDKLYEYEAAGIKEYWLIEPLRQQAEFYVLSESGHYERVAGGASGISQSVVLPGFWLKIEWLWQDPLPAPLRTLAEIAGIDPSAAAAFDRHPL